MGNLTAMVCWLSQLRGAGGRVASGNEGIPAGAGDQSYCDCECLSLDSTLPTMARTRTRGRPIRAATLIGDAEAIEVSAVIEPRQQHETSKAMLAPTAASILRGEFRRSCSPGRRR
jgi:hypothetical protein